VVEVEARVVEAGARVVEVGARVVEVEVEARVVEVGASVAEIADVPTMSRGAGSPDSRLANRSPELLGVSTARSTAPAPDARGVTSTLVKVSAVTRSAVATTGPGVGAVL
jgi:hypothetical protein